MSFASDESPLLDPNKIKSLSVLDQSYASFSRSGRSDSPRLCSRSPNQEDMPLDEELEHRDKKNKKLARQLQEMQWCLLDLEAGLPPNNDKQGG